MLFLKQSHIDFYRIQASGFRMTSLLVLMISANTRSEYKKYGKTINELNTIF